MKLAAVSICVVLLASAWGFGAAAAVPDDVSAQAEETATIREYKVEGFKDAVKVTVLEPTQIPPEGPALLIYLYGSGGSHTDYNLSSPSCDRLRELLSERGYYVVVPNLEPRHWMNEQAKQKLDALLKAWLEEFKVAPERVHLMGTSMGGGSVLAYAIHRPGVARSICAVMPITDFALWATESPQYGAIMQGALGGPPTSDAFKSNSAVHHLDAYADTPMLLIHGTDDGIVKPAHSETLAQVLQSQGAACELRLVDGVGHSDEIMRDLQTETADFFDAAMKSSAATNK